MKLTSSLSSRLSSSRWSDTSDSSPTPRFSNTHYLSIVAVTCHASHTHSRQHWTQNGKVSRPLNPLLRGSLANALLLSTTSKHLLSGQTATAILSRQDSHLNFFFSAYTPLLITRCWVFFPIQLIIFDDDDHCQDFSSQSLDAKWTDDFYQTGKHVSPTTTWRDAHLNDLKGPKAKHPTFSYNFNFFFNRHNLVPGAVERKRPTHVVNKITVQWTSICGIEWSECGCL